VGFGVSSAERCVAEIVKVIPGKLDLSIIANIPISFLRGEVEELKSGEEGPGC
jgi:hypothetical protein